jgi:hypothetical protein
MVRERERERAKLMKENVLWNLKIKDTLERLPNMKVKIHYGIEKVSITERLCPLQRGRVQLLLRIAYMCYMLELLNVDMLGPRECVLVT